MLGFVVFLVWIISFVLGLDYRASHGAFALLCPLTCYVMLKGMNPGME